MPPRGSTSDIGANYLTSIGSFVTVSIKMWRNSLRLTKRTEYIVGAARWKGGRERGHAGRGRRGTCQQTSRQDATEESVSVHYPDFCCPKGAEEAMCEPAARLISSLAKPNRHREKGNEADPRLTTSTSALDIRLFYLYPRG